jgi:hypothetical protein
MNTTPQNTDSEWFTINGVETFKPFLVSIVSDEDHWLFAASNGGLTAGRSSPEKSLFPYYTQDKLIDLAATTGPVTHVRERMPSGEYRYWSPFDTTVKDAPRSVSKRSDGTQLTFEEVNEDLQLVFRYTWAFSRRYGFVRRSAIESLAGADRTVEILDGVQNLQPYGVSDEFQNDYSILVDAYKRSEAIEGTSLRLTYLSSIPTDRAEPSESLRAVASWTVGIDASAQLVSSEQIESFLNGDVVTSEHDKRGIRAACIDVATLRLSPKASSTWYWVGDVALSTAQVSKLHKEIKARSAGEWIDLIESEIALTGENLQKKVGSADGIQLTADRLRNSRHFSNVMFNIMRGGVFLDNGRIDRGQFLAHLKHFNQPLSDKLKGWGASLPEQFTQEELLKSAMESQSPELIRLAGEYLPLTFSRRHGDPSRPWNRFAIHVRDANGQPRFAYQGNWRDIFQNWETLMHSFPGYLGGAIFRFLNATTADGYNPYRVTNDGFDWEKIDPDEPWSNIGYWGDHQIIYLLRLLEASRRFQPQHLSGLLQQAVFAYAQVPYCIRPYDDIVKDPRSSISYDDEGDAAIASRVKKLGADGQLLPKTSGEILHVPLMEKLLVPLLAKLSNFVPDGGIWMNTQRPEWNDANNALVGYGISVVTMSYCHRYLAFMIDWLGELPESDSYDLSDEVAAWLQDQIKVFSATPECTVMHPDKRREFMDTLGQSASRYRMGLYENGLSGSTTSVNVGALLGYLKNAKAWLNVSLKANRRSDGLYHSYNLLRFAPSGGVEVSYLYEMLEGQVAILSARVLKPSESLEVMKALRQSRLYRADQASYLLYPDRDLPGFLEKNLISADFVQSSKLIQALQADAGQSIIEEDGDGALRFAGSFRNADELETALNALPEAFSGLVKEEGKALMNHFEDIFNHHAFTGRSGTFFAYEGLGSIYWHMVSKLVLAIEESVLANADTAEDRALLAEMKAHFDETLRGLGMEKDPKLYGAFPTDAYSHTPKHAGAQQPGMTGQVKEDILIRLAELGVTVSGGAIEFKPRLLREKEFLKEAEPFHYFDVQGARRSIDVEAGSIAFTVCQVPVIYRLKTDAKMSVQLTDGGTAEIEGTALSRELSESLFRRTHQVSAIIVDLPSSWIAERFFAAQ